MSPIKHFRTDFLRTSAILIFTVCCLLQSSEAKQNQQMMKKNSMNMTEESWMYNSSKDCAKSIHRAIMKINSTIHESNRTKRINASQIDSLDTYITSALPSIKNMTAQYELKDLKNYIVSNKFNLTNGSIPISEAQKKMRHMKKILEKEYAMIDCMNGSMNGSMMNGSKACAMPIYKAIMEVKKIYNQSNKTKMINDSQINEVNTQVSNAMQVVRNESAKMHLHDIKQYLMHDRKNLTNGSTPISVALHRMHKIIDILEYEYSKIKCNGTHMEEVCMTYMEFEPKKAAMKLRKFINQTFITNGYVCTLGKWFKKASEMMMYQHNKQMFDNYKKIFMDNRTKFDNETNLDNSTIQMFEKMARMIEKLCVYTKKPVTDWKHGEMVIRNVTNRKMFKDDNEICHIESVINHFIDKISDAPGKQKLVKYITYYKNNKDMLRGSKNITIEMYETLINITMILREQQFRMPCPQNHLNTPVTLEKAQHDLEKVLKNNEIAEDEICVLNTMLMKVKMHIKDPIDKEKFGKKLDEYNRNKHKMIGKRKFGNGIINNLQALHRLILKEIVKNIPKTALSEILMKIEMFEKENSSLNVNNVTKHIQWLHARLTYWFTTGRTEGFNSLNESLYHIWKNKISSLNGTLAINEEKLEEVKRDFFELLMKIRDFLEMGAEKVIDVVPEEPTRINPREMCAKKLGNGKSFIAVIKRDYSGPHMKLRQRNIDGSVDDLKTTAVNGNLELHVNDNGCGCTLLRIECRAGGNEKKSMEFTTYLCNLRLIGEKFIVYNNEVPKMSIRLDESCFGNVISNISLDLTILQIQLNSEVSFEDKNEIKGKQDKLGWLKFSPEKPIKLKFFNPYCPQRFPLAVSGIIVGYLHYFPKASLDIDVCSFFKNLNREDCYRKFTTTKLTLKQFFSQCEKRYLLEDQTITIKNTKYNNITVWQNGLKQDIPMNSKLNISMNTSLHIIPLKKSNKLELIIWKDGKMLMKLDVRFKALQCGEDGEFTGCEKLKAKRDCKSFSSNETLFNLCVKCREDHVTGEIDKCGHCFKSPEEKVAGSKCVCSGEGACKQCSVAKFKNKCLPCELSKIPGCNGACVLPNQRGNCLRINQDGCFINSNRNGQCQLQSESASCSMTQINKEVMLQRPRPCFKSPNVYGVASNCTSGEYDVVCQVGENQEKVEKFDYKKKESLNLQLIDTEIKASDYKKIQIKCKNSDGCNSLKCKMNGRKNDLHIDFDDKTDTYITPKLKFISNQKYNFTCVDCCGGSVMFNPTIVCKPPKVISLRPIKDNFKIDFDNEVRKLSKQECSDFVMRKKSIIVKKIDKSILGSCIRSKCQQDSSSNDFSTIVVPDFLKIRETCKRINFVINFKANFSCHQMGGANFSSEDYSLVIERSDLDIMKPISCNISSTDRGYMKSIEYTIKNKKGEENCLEIRKQCNKQCYLHVLGNKEVRWVVSSSSVDEIAQRLPLSKLRNFVSSQEVTVYVELENNPNVNTTKNFTVPKFFVELKARSTNLNVKCGRNIRAKELFQIQLERGLQIQPMQFVFTANNINYEQEVFNEISACDTTVELVASVSIKPKDGGLSYELSKTISIQYTSVSCPAIQIDASLFANSTCKKRLKVVASNVNNFAEDVGLKLTQNGNDVVITNVCKDVANKPNEKICCFTESNIEAGVEYLFTAEVEGTQDGLCQPQTAQSPIFVEEELQVDITCPGNSFEELYDNVEFTITEAKGRAIIVTFEQIHQIEAAGDMVVMKVILGLPIGVLVQTENGQMQKELTVPQICLDKIQARLSSMNEAARAAACQIFQTYLPDYIICSSKVRWYERNLLQSSKRRRRRSVESLTCEQDSVETCSNQLSSIKSAVENGEFEDQMPNLIKAPVCDKACTNQIPCTLAFEVINLYFHQKKGNEGTFTKDESDFFHCGYSAVIFPVVANIHMTNAIGNFTVFINHIQQELVRRSFETKQPTSSKSSYIETYVWLYEGRDGAKSFYLNTTEIQLNEMFQNTYDEWECLGGVYCTTTYVALTKMKLYYDSATSTYKDPLSVGTISEDGFTPITDIYIANFFSTAEGNHSLIELDDHSKYYLIKMPAYQKNENATIKCYHFDKDSLSWKPTTFNAVWDGQSISCACPKSGPCTAFVVSDLVALIPTNEPETTTSTTAMTSTLSETSNSSTSTVASTLEPMAYIKNVEITLNADFANTVAQFSSEEACRKYLCNNTRLSLNVSEDNFQNCSISSGSIILQFIIAAVTENGLNSTISTLKNLVSNSTLEILLPDGSKIIADKDSYKEGSDLSTTNKPPVEEEEDDDHVVIIIVVCVILGLGLIVVIFVVFIMCKKNKDKVKPVHESSTSMKHLSSAR